MVLQETEKKDRTRSDSEEAELLADLSRKIEECKDNHVISYWKHLTVDQRLGLIRTRKYNTDRALNTLVGFVTCFSVKYPETFVNMHPSKHEKLLRRDGFGTLAAKDSKGRGVIYLRASQWDPNQFTLDEVILTLVLIGYEMIREKDIQINGVQIIIDAKGFCFRQAKQVTLFTLRKYIDILINTSALKLKGIHIINSSYLVEITWKVAKIIVPSKIKKRLFFHHSIELLHDYISKEILPDWLGGIHPESEVKDNDLIDIILSPEREDWFRKITPRAKEIQMK